MSFFSLLKQDAYTVNVGFVCVGGDTEVGRAGKTGGRQGTR